MCEIYATTFCNFGHRLKDGKPVEHECFIIRPKMLQMEHEHGAQACLDYMRETGEAFHTGQGHAARRQALEGEQGRVLPYPAFADERHYRKPKNANGSRARYFHAYLNRRAALAEILARFNAKFDH